MTCTHTRRTDRYIESYIDDWGDRVGGYWKYGEEGTYEDIDIHRYRCTQCHEVFYYSSHAREYYEGKVPHKMNKLGMFTG